MGWALDNATLVSIVVIIIVVIVAVILHGVLQEKWATLGVSILITVLIGLWLNHFLAVSRERDQRRWTLRQEHLVRLRPVLRADSEKLSEVARRIHVEGHVTDTNRDKASYEAELSLLFSPDILSRDVRNHYPEYSQGKERLRKEVAEQEEEFRETIVLVAKRLSLPRVAENRRLGVVLSLLEKCLEKGPGMTLTRSSSGYAYSFRGGSASVGGSPPQPVPDDILAAFEAFKSFRPESEVTAHCENLKRRAASISENAKKLSAEALTLVERTTLSGTCEYTRLE